MVNFKRLEHKHSKDYSEGLGNHQKHAFNDAMQGNNLFITGAGGVGKSEVLNRIVYSLRQSGKRVAVTASTGIAAVNLGGTTIHSLLNTGICGNIEEARNKLDYKNKKYAKLNLQHVDTIVIDEVSMLSSDYIDMMNWWLKYILGGREVFAGKQLIFSGDLLQLKFVNKDYNKIMNPVYMSGAWAEADIHYHYLTEVFRQTDEEFIKNLCRLRVGDIDKEVLDYFNSRVHVDLEKDPIKIFPRNSQVNELNRLNLKLLDTKEENYEAHYDGSEYYINFLKRNCVAEENLFLKEKAPVIFTKNNKGLNYYNGLRGVIRRFNRDGTVTVLSDRGSIIHVERETWNIQDPDGEVMASVNQIPLKLCFAVTVHRSQGATLDYIDVDPKGIFTDSQAYVALSRCRSLEGIRLSNKLDFNHVTVSPLDVEFYNFISKKTGREHISVVKSE